VSTKKKTVTQTQSANTLPDWLTSPFQAAQQSASSLASQPAIGTNTQAALGNIRNSAAQANNLGGQAANTLSGIASGNFGQPALTGAADGSYLSSNIFANGSANNGFANGGITNPFRENGGLDTSFLQGSGLQDTAAGKYLTADSNPYIRGVAQQGADQAQAAINGQFGAAGRSNGSGLYAQLFGEGISNATNNVYAQNYANERQLQQGAQGTLLSSEQAAREAALGRQYGATEADLGRQYGATEANLGRQSSAYESERSRQQAAAGGLLNTQLSASSQLPSLLAAIASGNNQALAAGQYEDQAPLARQQQYVSLLSSLAAPYGMSSSSGTQTQSTGGLGTTLGTIAQLGGAAASLYGGGGLSGLAGLGGATSASLGGINSGLNLQSLGLSGWR